MSRQAVQEQRRQLEELLLNVDEAFQRKQDSSTRREWCNPVSVRLKIDTIQAFLHAMHDPTTLETHTCALCYLKRTLRDLEPFDWKQGVPDALRLTMAPLFGCSICFPPEAEGPSVPACCTCRRALSGGKVPPDCMGSTMQIGCEHRYPAELRQLTPLEEKLIALDSAYGFITKFNVKRGQDTGPTYRRHVKGHITVFPVESVSAILPHPLISTLEKVHIIWTGPDRPTPRDVGNLPEGSTTH